jgi:hypothetical protein
MKPIKVAYIHAEARHEAEKFKQVIESRINVVESFSLSSHQRKCNILELTKKDCVINWHYE